MLGQPLNGKVKKVMQRDEVAAFPQFGGALHMWGNVNIWSTGPDMETAKPSEYENSSQF